MRHPKKIIFHTLTALLIIAISSSCSSKINMQPQIDEVSRIHLDQSLPNQGHPSWNVGQWALYKTSHSSREEIFRLFDSSPVQGFRKIAITGQFDGSFWLEQHIVWPDHEQYIAALVSDQPDKQLKITQLKFTQDNGEIVEVGQQNLGADSAESPLDEMQYLLNLIEHSHRVGRIRNITVAAGTFENTNEVPFSISLRFGKLEGNVLYSNAVPVSTLVKLHSTHDTSGWFKDISTWELADFGHSGATSHFSLQ